MKKVKIEVKGVPAEAVALLVYEVLGIDVVVTGNTIEIDDFFKDSVINTLRLHGVNFTTLS